MNTKQIALLLDANIKPTDKIICDCLGKAHSTYVKFVDGLERHNISLMEWRYYNDSKAWLTKGEYKWITSRGTEKVKPIFWLSIWKGFFKVAFFFSRKVQDELLALPISTLAKNIIINTKPMGKTMKFLPISFDISDNKLLEDVYILAQFRKENI